MKKIILLIVVLMMLVACGGSADITRLTNNDGMNESPSWSPDGAKIVFVSTRDGNRDSDNREIYTMNSDGSNPTNISNNDAADYQPSWSPDGTKIAFSSDRDGNSEIYVMDYVSN